MFSVYVILRLLLGADAVVLGSFRRFVVRGFLLGVSLIFCYLAVVENVGKKYADQNKVTLNVGGTHFVTMRSTLLRFENTYFSALLGTEGRWKSEEEDGSYFLDRNPMGFDYVLDYMRDGDLKNFKVIKPEVLAKFKEHLEYLLLPLPPVLEAKKENQWSKKACSRKLVVEGKVLTKAVGDGDYNSGALGTAPNPVRLPCFFTSGFVLFWFLIVVYCLSHFIEKLENQSALCSRRFCLGGPRP